MGLLGKLSKGRGLSLKVSRFLFPFILAASWNMDVMGGVAAVILTAS